MIFFFLILIIFFSFLIIKSKGEERLAYFYVALFLIPENVSLTPNLFYFKQHLIFITCFFISLIRYRELDLSDFKKTEMYVPLVLVFIAYLLVGLMDERLNIFSAIYKATYFYEGTYFAFLVGWLAISKKNSFDISIFLRKFLRYSLIATVFGIVTFIIKDNPILDDIGFEDRFVKESVEMEIRSFRVTSFFVSSSVYAIACGYLSFMGIVFLRNKKLIDIIAILLLFVNCMLSGTRAGIFPVLILFLLHYILMFKQKFAKVKKFVFVSIAILALSYLIMPSVINNVINQYSTMLISVADDEAQEEMNGSSIDARTLQMASAMEYLQKKPLFGHGMGYAKEILADGRDEELLGMESYICFLGVEYGGVFIACIIIFFLSIFRYYFKALSIDREKSLIGLCMLLCFILFLIYAWVGDSWIYILPILGLIAKQISLRNETR